MNEKAPRSSEAPNPYKNPNKMTWSFKVSRVKKRPFDSGPIFAV